MFSWRYSVSVFSFDKPLVLVDYLQAVQKFLVFSFSMEFSPTDISWYAIFLLYKLYHLGLFHTAKIIE